MTQFSALPSVDTIPEDIDDRLRHLIHDAPEKVTAEWLCDLVRNSGHLTTPEYLRWRVVSLIWLGTQFDADKAWPYLLWLNMNEPVMSDHLSEIVTDGAEELQCHVQLANWMATAADERLIQFVSTYRHNLPAHKLGPLFGRLRSRSHAPETGVWLASFCRDSSDDPSPLMRPWHLLAAAWYAACFNPTAGLSYLRASSSGQAVLSSEDSKLLTETADDLNLTAALIQWLATCSDASVKNMLRDFGHPDPAAFAKAIFENPPNYDHLAESAVHAGDDAQTFKRNLNLLETAGVLAKTAKVLDLACGPLAAQTLLLSSAGYQTIGVDLHIPPDYLPLSGFKQRLKKGKYVKAWKAATAAYYGALKRYVDGLRLKWGKVKIELADVTRLKFPHAGFDAVICVDYLHHAPDVSGLLAEAERVLKPGGLLLADIKPFTTLTGDFQTTNSDRPWGHLRGTSPDSLVPSLMLNKWRESEYQAAVEQFFTVEQWLTEQDDAAVSRLAPEIKAELSGYSEAELCRKKIVFVGRKKG